MNRLQIILITILKSLGLLEFVRRLRRLIMLLTKPEYRRQESGLRRRERVYQQRYRKFKLIYGDVLRSTLNTQKGGQKKVLVVGANFPEIEIELGLIKALEIAGFTPVALITHRRLCLQYYKLAGIKEIHFLSKFTDPPDLAAAEAIINRARSVQDLMTVEYNGIRVGKFAISTALREVRVGYLDFREAKVRKILANYVASGMAYATAVQRILQRVKPQLALFHDRVYSPEGELFDSCWANGIDAIRWHPAHKSDTLLLKRYTHENRDEHPVSLSSKSWELVRRMKWTDSRRELLKKELYSNYASGDWYSEGGGQYNKRFMDAEDLRRKIGLDPAKKTAFIFPHILWDASLNWGKDLFRDYEECFIETVRKACANEQVNWVIKIHPANVSRSLQDGARWEPAEVIALNKYIGELPPHISMIPAESPISTFSLYAIMDYCLTVRGTVGIEAAIFGIPVLTSGTGRYDHRGFTIDSDSREQYLDRIAHIQEIPRLSTSQQELAERYAYGLFVMRPLCLKTVTFQYPAPMTSGGTSIKLQTQINIKNYEEWYRASDLKAFTHWVTDSNQSDFLMPLAEE